MKISNIAGYKFINLTDLNSLCADFLLQLQTLEIKGTILLSQEGININLAGPVANIRRFQSWLQSDDRFDDFNFHESFSEKIPFRFLKVKIKKEIITLRQPDVNAVTKRAPDISPQELKQWLDEKRDFTLLDTRNDYETRFGTFVNAVKLAISDFCEFPYNISHLDKDKPVVMFCTGGIRCEKAAIYMQNRGYKEVYQLDGGILAYFDKVGNSHYDGECFVFDERVAVDSKLAVSGTTQCVYCQGPIKQTEEICPECLGAD